MVTIFLVLMIGGIGLTQAASDPQQVTLRWLRLGGLITIALLAVAATVQAMTDVLVAPLGLGMLFIGVAASGQLLTVQLARRQVQRIFALLVFVASCAAAATQHIPPLLTAPSAGLLGGFLMTMLLGHAYLTAGNEMTQRPFLRLVVLLAALLTLRAVSSVVFGLLPYLQQSEASFGGSLVRMWDMVTITARYLVGLAVPAVFTYMTYDCVKRRANQSATGILYVAGVLIIVGEGAALALLRATGNLF